MFQEISVGKAFPGVSQYSSYVRHGGGLMDLDEEGGLHLTNFIPNPNILEMKAIEMGIKNYGIVPSPAAFCCWTYGNTPLGFETNLQFALYEDLRMERFLESDSNVIRRVTIDGSGTVISLGMMGLDLKFIRALKEALLVQKDFARNHSLRDIKAWHYDNCMDIESWGTTSQILARSMTFRMNNRASIHSLYDLSKIH